jgi:hypothetical protein
MLAADPARRIGLDDVLADEWLAEENGTDQELK